MKNIACLLAGLLLKSAALAGGSVTIPLQICPYGSNFYCIQVVGDSFQQLPPLARFDSGSSSLSVPESCLNPKKITVIQRNVINYFGQLSDVVKGDISLKTATGQLITVSGMYFFALKNRDCVSTENVNFGAFQLPTVVKTEDKESCLANFFTLYNYANNTAGVPFGYTLLGNESHAPYLLLGPIENAAPAQQMLRSPHRICSGVNSLNLFQGAASKSIRWRGPSVPGFDISINQVNVPPTALYKPSSDPLMADHKVGMIDSGGGSLIIHDDADLTITKAINAKEVVLSAANCDNSTGWLSQCQCLASGVEVTVKNDPLNIQYSYASTRYEGDPRRSVMVCAPNKARASAFNAANLGYQLFNNYNVSFDYALGRILFEPEF